MGCALHLASAASGLTPLRHGGETHAPTPTRDYRPRASRFHGRQRENPVSCFLQESNDINKLYKNKTQSPSARAKRLRLAKKTKLVKTKQGGVDIGGGTWLHPDLAIVFARWLDVRFAVWCDRQIKAIIHGTHDLDWHKVRREAAGNFKGMSQVLQQARTDAGKDTMPHHYMVEAKLISGVITDSYTRRDRDLLPAEELGVVSYLETHNTALITRGMSYTMRQFQGSINSDPCTKHEAI